MLRKLQDVELDIAEVKELILNAKRQSNQTVLAKHLSNLKNQLESLTPKKVEEPEEPKVKKEAPTLSYTTLTKYSWDQEGNKVKIYFLLDNIGNECSKEQIEVQFEKQALDLRIHGYNKLNYLFVVKKLAGKIDTELSKFTLKKNSLILTLVKKDSSSWSEIHFKEDKYKETKDEQGKTDPNASLMNMMKKMYDEGDDNMKRTIAEAWTKSQDKKGEKDGGMPGMGGMGGMGGMPGMEGLGGMGGKGLGGLKGMKGMEGLGDLDL